MSDTDYLCYLVYMYASYMFPDATLVSRRVNIYDEDNEVILSLYVNSATPDSIEFVKANAGRSAEAVTVMNSFIVFLRMIHDVHAHPFDVINRLVSVSR